MEAKTCWEWFCATGDPAAYMLYRIAEETEEKPEG